ncbi:type III pantothenate kinase [Verrucomicrobiaceae bacterium R5-34]|uniref:Type III pantothenate kinase n=1 Tax=Oceaniferula flava TaxID=2800421 RepID=A0AAE2SDF9_9BACT|nr:type III pantothenate kinase [Oceaniferula flavus]MBK1829868.1 type III pantothenate kinase [Verrucomicrobiaceae bacterium R5-34]MBK1856338.1 type III pantothenate kinase [Oceaniferula flavus]MBM1137645.1 type III pantothenate kinase [Oceaniferula flavus]
MRLLLIDNSNTRTKFTLSSADALGDWSAVIPTCDISESSLASTLASCDWDASLISSVVPAKAAVLEQFLAGKPCHSLSHRSRLPIGIDYPSPQQIGADRLANAAAAHVMFGSPAIVLDFGTAVTFDVLGLDDAQQPVYQGGVIAPGLASMTEGLARRTALLPHIELEEPTQAIGKSTEQAMLAGAVFGYRGLVREIIQQIQAELPGEANIIATGGDATLITRGLPEIHQHCPQLTLEGLRLIANLNL